MPRTYQGFFWRGFLVGTVGLGMVVTEGFGVRMTAGFGLVVTAGFGLRMTGGFGFVIMGVLKYSPFNCNCVIDAPF